MYLAREWEEEFREYKGEELKYNEAIYDNVNDRQFNVIQKYFRWRTRVRFQEIVKDTSLQALPKKAENMAKIIGDDMDWVYDGCVDTGYFGGGQCELGHALRYEHYAVSPSTGREIIFGVKCVSDFFGIDPKRLRGISKVQDEVLEEVKIIVFIMETNKYTQYIQKYYPDLMKVIKTLKPNADKLFGKDWSNQIAKFIQSGLPLTPSLIDRFRWVKNKYYDKKQKKTELMDAFEEQDRDILKNAFEVIGDKPITYIARMAVGAVIREYNYSIGDKKILALMGAAVESHYNKYASKGFDMEKLDNMSNGRLPTEDKQCLNAYLFVVTGVSNRLKNAGVADDVLYGNRMDILLKSSNKIAEALDWIDKGGLELAEERLLKIEAEEEQANRSRDINDIDIEEKLELIYKNRHKNQDHWAVEIALDIRNKLKYRSISLSEKQVKMVNIAYEILLPGDEEAIDADKGEDPSAIRFNENKHKIDMIIKNKESELPINKFVFKVINTVNKTNRITDKQIIYIEDAYRIVVEELSKEEEANSEPIINEAANKDNMREEIVGYKQGDVVDNKGGKAAVSIPSITEMSGALGKGLLERGD